MAVRNGTHRNQLAVIIMAYAKRHELQRAIQEHLLAHGPKDWDVVQGRFPDCPARTFYRYVRQTKALPPLPEHVEIAIDRARQVLGARKTAPDADEQPLLSVPLVPISYLTQEGPAALRKLDLIKSIQSVNDDLDALRDYAMSSEDGSVSDPRVLADSIKLRMTLAELFLNAVQHIWSQERQAQFFQSVMDSIRHESPESAKRIIQRLREVNQMAG